MASERAAAFADEFAAANAQAIAFVQGCTDEQWAVVVPGEEWPVGVVLHHIAESHLNGVRWLTAMTAGEPVTDSRDGIDQVNAERAAPVSRAETVDLLLHNGAVLEAFLRALSDEALERTAPFGPAEGRELPAHALAPVTSSHVRGHLAHARAALNLSD